MEPLRVTDDQAFAGDPNRPLKHRPFFVAASEMRENSPEYRSMLAGLLMLRLIDKWPEPVGRTSDDNDARIADFVPVKNHIEAIDDTPIKRVLSDLLEAVSNFSYGQEDRRLAPLIAYAQFLEQGEHWEPAADTYRTAIDVVTAAGRARDDELLLMCYGHAAACLREVGDLPRAHDLLSTGIEIATKQDDRATEVSREYWLHHMRVAIAIVGAQLLERGHAWDSAASIYIGAIDLINTRPAYKSDLLMCYERAAYCYRQIGEIDRAADLLHTGIETALALQDVRWSLYLRISNAVLELQKGDLPEAEFELDTIIAEATRLNEPGMLARATHERGMVAYERNQYERAVGLFHAAASAYTDPRMKHRVLPDIAMALSDLGHHDYARNVYLFIRNATQTESEPRTIAGLNLMKLAEMTADRATFERYRAEVATEPMSGRLKAHFHLIAGEGFRRFGDAPAARKEFEEAIGLARQYRVYKLLTEAETMLSSTDDRPIPWKQPSESPALSVLFNEIDTHTGVFAGATL